MADRATLSRYLKKVTGELRDAHRRVAELEGRAVESVAIIGMSCRFPGGVGTPDDLWDLLAEGHDGIGAFPADRGWDLERLFDPDPDRPGTSYAREGGFLDDVAGFDADFFDISPRESVATDPQQRLLLEGAWEALENGGIDPASLRGEPAGVFAGVMHQDYRDAGAADAELEAYRPAGGSGSVVSGRVAYSLGLEGPAVTIDTACSSSLVALHLASQALRGGECSLAIAGGVTALATPSVFTELARQRGLARDGRCKSFSDAADGAGFSEGVGVLVLERLSDAEANGHHVLATIRGSAVNQDGASNGLTAPNGPSQERVIRQALVNARLTTKDVDMVEAHGTGTALGDPIEAGALLATYGRERETPLRLGSIKSNIGHTQAAAGVAGVIKTVLAMREGTMPKTLHVDQPSSKVDWEAGEIELLTEAEPWEPNGRPRRAAVSSFGISGTNAHLILEEAPAPAEVQAADGEAREQPLTGPIPLALSAKSPEALSEGASRLATHLKANPDQDLTDTAYSLLTTRSTFEHRAVAVGEEREQLLGALTAIAEGKDSPHIAQGKARTSQPPVFCFPGQGSQWQGMAAQLIEEAPLFEHHLSECEAALDPHIDFSLRDVLLGKPDAASSDRIEVIQPALFATMVALARLWEACGAKPAATVGHSQGEIAAAHIAGALSLEDAARIAALRSQLIAKLTGKGAMLSIALGKEALAQLLLPYKGQIEIAAQNGPSSTILSAQSNAASELLAHCEKEGIRAKQIPATIPSHSAMVEPLREELLEALSPLSPQAAEVPFHSTVTGAPIDGTQLDAEYWYRNLRQPVLFEAAIAALAKAGQSSFVEISPHPVFALPVQETLEANLPDPSRAAVIGTLRREEGGAERFCLSLAEAHANGVEVQWPSYFKGSRAKPTKLPTYPFQRKRYWLSATSAAANLSAAGLTDADHPLLGAAISDPDGEGLTLTGRLSLATHPWLADHAVAGTVLLPGTAFLELALRAAEQLGAEQVQELTLQAPLILPESAAVQIQVSVASPDEDGSREIRIHSRPETPEGEEAEWALNAEGLLSEEALSAPEPLTAWPPEGAEPLEAEFLYDRLAEAGFEYGPAFQGLSSAWKHGDEVFAEVSLAEEQAPEATRFGLHPALLDCALHGALLAGLQDGEAAPELKLPFAWNGVSVQATGANQLRVGLSEAGEGVSISLTDEAGEPVAQVTSLIARPVSPEQLQAARSKDGLLAISWQERQLEGAGESTEPELWRHQAKGDQDPKAARKATAEALTAIQAWLAREDPEPEDRLAILTEGAIATSEQESPDPAQAAIWGLIRSAQSEHPASFLLIDSDGSEGSEQALASALAQSEEPQIALREGKTFVPRATRLTAEQDTTPIDPDKTILITGATGTVGSLTAKHLVKEHGAKNLLLISRQGEQAKGAKELAARLQEQGAKATIAACDASDPGQLKELLDSIPKAAPLGAVFHSAAALDDATIESLTPERLDSVFAPKADGAWALHQLTKDKELSHFVIYSSAAGTLGGPAQGNYAAANSYCDALAQQRKTQGLPASSIAWGYWQTQSDLTAKLTEADHQRLRRGGIAPLTDSQGLALLDQALTSQRPDLLGIAIEPSGLRSMASLGVLPPILSSLIRIPKRRAQAGGSLAKRLAELPEADRPAHVLELLRAETAAVLGHDSAKDIEPSRAFSELGFDSLAALELRNRLSATTGLRLAPTVVFDYPSAEKLASHLLAEVTASGIAKVAVRSQATDEPIAIVGMSCRYPGGVGSPEELWRLLEEGRDAIEPFPTDRGWDLERLYDADPESIGTSYAREGGFLGGATEFDPEFFSISPREATEMDPQQRLLLEGAWEALEDAGIAPASLRGSEAGVFAGLMYQDYGSIEDGVAPGMRASIVSGRVAYSLGLEGPAMTVDTACSSSLVALHLASQALRGGECSLALAGGVSVLSTPASFTEFSRQRALAPDGRCKPFADAADGTGFSEGIGVLVLERLSDAEANGHHVLATIRGSAVNQDGASNGLTAPNGPSQERVIRQALANARLAPQDVDMVEAHGTGTTLGDPIEAGALLATYGRERETPLRLGSIKSNIGHTAAAAGVAGVIKAVLAMREGTMPRTLHVDEPSSKVEWEAGQVELLTEPVAWEANGHPRRAAVSSFGASGTNAHLILEEAPAPVEVEASGEGETQPLSGPIPLALSAKSEEALRESAERLATHLKANPDQDLTDTAYSLLTTRSTFEHRAVAVGEEREQLLGALTAIAEGKDSPHIAQGKARTSQPPVFCFPGQGSQWQGMAAQLIEEAPLFEHHLSECEAALDPHIDFSLRDVLLGKPDAASSDRIEVIQPALFATMVALARLWEACGAKPAATVGHSQGEIAAAHIAGALSLEDAARIAALRSQLIAKLTGKGAMLSIALGKEALAQLLLPYKGQIEIAAQNGPSSTILSAQSNAASELLAHCEKEGIRAKQIPATIPSHSAMVEPLREELLEALSPLSPQAAEVPFHSTVTGAPIDGTQLDAEYWYRNLRQPVLFEAAIAALAKAGQSSFVEISPHPVFALPVQETLEANLPDPSRAAVIGTLRREEGGAERFCLSLAEAHANGVEVQWPSYFKGSRAKPTKLPTYPFQRKRYWLSATSAAANLSAAGLTDADHPLLGAAISDPDGEGLTLTGRLSLATHPWLADHAVAGTVLLPGTAFLELALRAAEQLGAEQVQELTLQAPLILPESGAVQIQVSVASPDEDGSREIRIHSRPESSEDEEAEWALNAEGLLCDEALSAPEPLEVWPPEGAEPLEAEFLYDRLAEAGFEYGPAFQGLSSAWKHGDEVFAEVSLAEEQAPEAARFALHPALLDCALHSLLLAGLGEGGSAPELRLPFSWSGVSLSAEGPSALRVRLSGAQGENVSISLADEAGEPVASVASLIARPVSAEQLSAAGPKEGLLGISWQERQLPEAGESPGVETWRHQAKGDQDPTAARQATVAALAAIQAWLAREDPAPEDRLAILTEGAIATDPEQSPDPAQAAIWGLIRSAQSEHPGSFLLIDSDGSEASEGALSFALAQSEEPQLALREGVVLVPRATRLAPEQEGVEIDPDKTILITGATGTVGSLTAHHLVKEHGAKNLLLISRQGEQAKGAKELAARLQEQGAKATIAACDASDPGQLKELLDSIPKAAPLGAVFHSAAALDDATIDSLTPERLDSVFAPKADGAWALHQLTKDKELSHFVIYSSAAGTLGGPAQGNYAAANSYCDALAQQRRTEGLPATSIAWGYWQTQSDLTAKLTEADHQRLRRSGIAPLTDSQGLALLDQALTSQRPDLLGIAIEPSGLRSMASLGVLPPILSSLIRIPKRRAQAGGSLAKRLAELPEADRPAHVLELLRAETAAVLGHDSAKDIEPSRAFSELGFDSLAALELRNRLGAATGLRLAPTVVFDYPSAEKLASHLLAEVTASGIAKVAVRSQATDEPIAIVGMSCRYPGGVGSPEELWELLAEGKDAIEPFPTDRGWDLERLYSPDAGTLNASYAREGGFLREAGGFDPEFFSISPREATEMDPQQRLLLEGAWEALEDAGIAPASLRGSEAGVFAGLMYQDYGAPQLGVSPGMTASIVSGRVAYSLGLEGPAVTIDTACSSSLVALHFASQALRGGECGLALAGGVSVLSTPAVFAEFSRQRGLARDGRCKPFAEAADGTGFSEGIGVLVLERLSDAQASGHQILATIRGSAINQDGATNGLTAPNGPSQERVIRQALANARLAPQDVDMVEAHGTGTTLGDPIEAGALLATYGQERETPLRLGSIKSNIGHTAAAAGVAGVIKAILAMREGTMPKTLHVDQPSTKVEWEAGEIELLTEPAEWQANGHPRRAAVSSFGASGTNAHLILEEAPAPAEVKEEDGGEQPLSGPIPLALSAKSAEALRESAERLTTHLKANPDQDLTDTAYSLLTTRSAFEHRAVAVGVEREEVLDALGAIAAGAPSANVTTAKAKSGPLTYLLTGQGSQRPGMGAELREAHPVYAEALRAALTEVDRHLERPLAELLFALPGTPEAELLDHTTYAQPALFATHIALHRLLESWGVRPQLLAGHSVGEISAAHISGVLSLSDAAKLICSRATLMGELPGGGAMLAIEATEPEAAEAIEGKEQKLSLAAVNSPGSIVISGTEEAIAAQEALWRNRGAKTKRLAVSHAFHSPLIEPMQEAFAEVAETLTYSEPRIPILSNLSGEVLGAEQATDPAYWVSHARAPVRFADAVATIAAQGVSACLELGPDAVLTAMAAECLAGGERQPALIATLREGRAEPHSLALAFGAAHAAGAAVDWPSYFAGSGAKPTKLPTYPFQRKRYWLSAASGPTDARSIGQSDADHPLLGAAIRVAGGEQMLFTGRLSLATHPWLADHAVAGTVLLPGTAFLELALRAAEQLGAEQVQELTLQAPLILPESAAVQIQVSVASPDEDGSRKIRIHSRPESSEDEEAEWALNAEGLLSDEALSAPEPLEVWPPEGAEPLEAEFLYDRLAEAGFEYGPAFQGLTKAWKAGEQVFAEVSLAEEQEAEAARFQLHPALLDSTLHATLLAGLQDGEAAPALKLPFSWNGVSVNATGASQLRVGLSEAGENVSISLADEAGGPVASVASLIARPVSAEQLSAAGPKEGLLGISWQERQLEGAGEGPEAETWRHEAKGDQDPTAARQATVAALTAIQAWLQREDPAPEDRLAILTEGAIATSEQESPDPAQAAIWGLARSAQSEHPGSFLLIDTDGSEASGKALASALAQSEEPQLALREGAVLVPRATRLAPEQEGVEIDPDKTILITGATGTVGSLTAKHLVKEHGAKNLLLISRQGEQAKGAKELAARLQEQGAKATIAACDASDPGQLKELLDSIPKAAPLGAVFHSAAALDDATIDSLTPERLDAVFAPKADGAWALHQLTKDKELSHFVIYSSAAGTLGGPAQGNYAAANSYCDALAQQRRTEGLPATSIAWGYWQTQSELTAKLTEADHQRLRRSGIAPLTDSQGLALLDQALTSQRPDLLGIAIEPSGLRSMASLGVLPPILSSLIRIPKRRAQAGGSLAKRLAELPEADRPAHVLELLRAETAAVLGHDSAKDIEPSRAFSELGFDSLAALELRNRLSAATGLRLAPTVVFDYPSAEKLAEHLLAEVTASGIAKVAVRSQATDEPIAIVGMSCRYPGGVSSPEELWELLAEGKDAIEPFPTDRGWDLERLYDADPESIGTSYAREGGFLADATEFDPEFFSISPREATEMDPQQRLLLEGAWEALEDAGIDPASLRGSEAGVFAGVMYQDYGPAPGMTTSTISGRVAYSLGLEGPAMTADTACSSSLVALHLASQALRGGECSSAIAGGVTVLATPTAFTEISRQRGLARDGRCKSFAEAADGTGFSEGIGVIVLERLSDAQANGHHVLATIRGSAINQDGASNGLTAPNGPSQERVIRQALANARLTTKDVDMVEAHGTGTTLGDPIEAGALLATYGQEREAPLRLGSLKSNIGHTQAAAGVGGVIKAVLAMREGTMPKTLHVDAPSTKVDWEAGEIELLTEAQPWEPNGHPRRAAVSSFGYSGTNAHLILEEAPAPAEVKEEDGGEQPLQGPIPLALSAKSPEALAESAERLATHLKANPGQDLTDTAFSLLTTRSSFEHRAVAVGTEREQLLDALSAIAEGKEAKDVARGAARSSQPPVFCFGGQGSQYPRMAAGLLEASPLFADRIERCEQALSPHVDWSLSEVLREADAKWMERLDIVQPALFAAMVALARLWEACGVRPSLVIGHSQGEVAAAHIAGALSLDDAARVIALRSKAMTKLAGKGAMASVSLPAEELGELLEPYADRISLAAVNGPRSQALSGEPEAIAELLKSCEQEGIRAKRIAVDYAAHSAQIEALEEELLDAFAPIEPKSAEVPLHSTLSGEAIDTASMDASYWYRNLRQTVLFGPVIETLLDQGHSHFLEISPHPVLGFGIAEAIEAKEAKATTSATLRKGEPDPQRFCLSLAEAHANGVEVQWPSYFKGSRAKPTKLPTYPFQRKRYWLAAASGVTDARSIGQSDADHPLLGAAISDPSGEGLTLTGRLSLATHPWLADHAVAGTVLLPGTAFLELALRAAEQLGAEQVQELTLQAPLILPESAAVQIQVSVASPDEDGSREIRIHSRPESPEGEEAEWALNAEGLLSDEALSAPEPLEVWPPEGAEPLDAEFLYDRLAEAGFEYGPAFQGLTKAWKAGAQVFAEVSLAEEQAPEAARFGLHPALLDCALHGALLAGLQDGEAAPALKLPFSWNGVSVNATGASQLRVGLSEAGENVSISLADEAGGPVAQVTSLIARPVSAEQLSAAGPKDGLLGISWQERQLPEAGESPEAETWRHQPQGDQDPTAARQATVAALAAIQAWLQREDPSPEDRLAILTEGAIATDEEQSPDPAQAAIWGLARSAQSEHPGSFLLIDSDGSEASEGALSFALAQSEEPQLALREGAVLVPRATRLTPEQEGVEIDPDKTILITGATGTVGSLTAKHLVKEHGAKNLLLISRQGEQAKGAKELAARLQEQGAKATIAACDASDPAQLKELLDAIPQEHPLGAVFHSAAALDDATIESLTPERLDAVFAPKADGAWALHQLTKDKELSHFVIYSSAAGTLGGPAQGNYAAANSYCDALAQQRRTEGLPATSIAWGYWQTQSDLTAKLTEADHQRLRRSGIAPLTDEQGLALLDQALTSQRPDLLGIAIEPSGLRSMASLGVLPPLLSSLIRIPKRRAQGGGSLAKRLAELPDKDRAAHVLELLRAETAAVLGHDSAKDIEPSRAFSELGFDSLAALELRNRLSAATGLRLAPTVVFDYPSAEKLAEHLLAEVSPDREASVDVELARLEVNLAALPGDDPNRVKLATHLRALAADLERNGGTRTRFVDSESLAVASDDELLDFIDEQVGGGARNG